MCGQEQGLGLSRLGARSGAGRGQFVCMGACIIGGWKLAVRRVRVVSVCCVSGALHARRCGLHVGKCMLSG